MHSVPALHILSHRAETVQLGPFPYSSKSMAADGGGAACIPPSPHAPPTSPSPHFPPNQARAVQLVEEEEQLALTAGAVDDANRQCRVGG